MHLEAIVHLDVAQHGQIGRFRSAELHAYVEALVGIDDSRVVADDLERHTVNLRELHVGRVGRQASLVGQLHAEGMVAQAPVCRQVGYDDGLRNVGHNVHYQLRLVLVGHSRALHGIGHLHDLVVQEHLQLVLHARVNGNGLFCIVVVGGRHIDVVGAFLQDVRTEDTRVVRRAGHGHLAGQGVGQAHTGTADMRAVAVVGTQRIGIDHIDHQRGYVGAHHRTLHLHVLLPAILWRQADKGFVGSIHYHVGIACDVELQESIAFLLDGSQLSCGHREPLLVGGVLYLYLA